MEQFLASKVQPDLLESFLADVFPDITGQFGRGQRAKFSPSVEIGCGLRAKLTPSVGRGGGRGESVLTNSTKQLF